MLFPTVYTMFHMKNNQVQTSVTRIYSNIQIFGTEYQIFEYEYLIFWLRIYSIFVFDQFAKNEYIRYSYSTNLLRTNIFVFVFAQKFVLHRATVETGMSGSTLTQRGCQHGGERKTMTDEADFWEDNTKSQSQESS